MTLQPDRWLASAAGFQMRGQHDKNAIGHEYSNMNLQIGGSPRLLGLQVGAGGAAAAEAAAVPGL